jgi:hypothetical protein
VPTRSTFLADAVLVIAATATMAVAAGVSIHSDLSFVGACTAMLVVLGSVLPRTSRMGLLGVVPWLVLATDASCSRAITASWHWLCGTGLVGALPVVPLVVGACAWLAAPTARRLHIRLSAHGLARPLLHAFAGLSFLTMAAALAQLSSAPDAEEVLFAATRPTVPAVAIVSSCAQHGVPCTIEVEGLDASNLPGSDDRRIEVIEGFGHRFVRREGARPREWLAYRPGAPPHEVQLTATDLPVTVAGPAGVGRAALGALAVAFVWLAAAAWSWQRARRLLRATLALVIAPGIATIGGAPVSCAPTIPPGPALALDATLVPASYRSHALGAATLVSGERRALVEAAVHDANARIARAALTLVLGVTPACTVLRAGLALVW